MLPLMFGPVAASSANCFRKSHFSRFEFNLPLVTFSYKINMVLVLELDFSHVDLPLCMIIKLFINSSNRAMEEIINSASVRCLLLNNSTFPTNHSLQNYAKKHANILRTLVLGIY